MSRVSCCDTRTSHQRVAFIVAVAFFLLGVALGFALHSPGHNPQLYLQKPVVTQLGGPRPLPSTVPLRGAVVAGPRWGRPPIGGRASLTAVRDSRNAGPSSVVQPDERPWAAFGHSQPQDIPPQVRPILTWTWGLWGSCVAACLGAMALCTVKRARHTSWAMSGAMGEFRHRLSVVKKVKKITDAMELVSASRLRRAQEVVTRSRPFAEALHEVFGEVCCSPPTSTGQGSSVVEQVADEQQVPRSIPGTAEPPAWQATNP